MEFMVKRIFKQSYFKLIVLLYLNLSEGTYIPYSPRINTNFANYFTPVYSDHYNQRAFQIPLSIPTPFNRLIPIYHNQVPSTQTLYSQFNQDMNAISIPEPVVNGQYPLLGRRYKPVINYNTAGDYTSEVDGNSNRYYYSLNPLAKLFTKFSLPRVSFKIVKEYGDTDIPMADCELKNRTRIEHGESIKVFCDMWTCVNGEIIKPPTPEYAKECPDDFEVIDKLGCIKLIDEKATWCDARRACFMMGADLVSLDNDFVSGSSGNNINNPQPLHDYLASINYNEQVWVGLSRTKTDLWDWTIGFAQITGDSALWLSGDPNEPGQWQCARYIKAHNKLADRFCDDRSMPHGGYFAYMCEVPGHDLGGCC